MQWKSETYIQVLDINGPFGSLFCERLSIAIFIFTLYCIIATSSNSYSFCYFLVCLEMYFVGNGDCTENDLWALLYHLFAEECDFC